MNAIYVEHVAVSRGHGEGRSCVGRQTGATHSDHRVYRARTRGRERRDGEMHTPISSESARRLLCRLFAGVTAARAREREKERERVRGGKATKSKLVKNPSRSTDARRFFLCFHPQQFLGFSRVTRTYPITPFSSTRKRC